MLWVVDERFDKHNLTIVKTPDFVHWDRLVQFHVHIDRQIYVHKKSILVRQAFENLRSFDNMNRALILPMLLFVAFDPIHRSNEQEQVDIVYRLWQQQMTLRESKMKDCVTIVSILIVKAN